MAHLACSNWFSSYVVRRLRDGKATLFWSHTWIVDVSLQDRFPRLFSVIAGVVVNAGIGDKWVWKHDLAAGFLSILLISCCRNVALVSRSLLSWERRSNCCGSTQFRLNLQCLDGVFCRT